MKGYIMKVTKMLKETRWEDLDWDQIERGVFRKMYRASQVGNVPEVRRLQRDLLKDPYAKLLSVRRVTSENTGRNTPGIDREIIRSNEERLALASRLNLSKDYHAKPLKRIYKSQTVSKDRWVSQRLRTGLIRHWSKSHLNRNGKQSSARTLMGSGLEEAPTMPRWQSGTT